MQIPLPVNAIKNKVDKVDEVDEVENIVDVREYMYLDFCQYTSEEQNLEQSSSITKSDLNSKSKLH